MDQSFDCGMPPSFIWCPVFLLKVGSISSLSLQLGISSKGLWCILEGPPAQPPISYGCLFPFLRLGIRASVLFPHLIPDMVQLFSLLTHLVHLPPPAPSLPPSPFMIVFFSFPSEDLDPSACWPFWVLWTVSWVVCLYVCIYLLIYLLLANIHLIVSIHLACPFGSELLHSGYFLV